MKTKQKAAQKADGLRGLSLRQRAFLREKIFGWNDKEAAIAAGYSLSTAENTKQKIWAKPGVREEHRRLKERSLAQSGAESASGQFENAI